MRVLLINPICYDNIQNFIIDGLKRKLNADECLSLGFLSSYIKQNLKDVSIRIYDHHIMCLKYIYENKYIDEKIIWDLLKEEIKEFNPEIIGISILYEYNSKIALEIIEFIKKIDSNIKIVIGGIFATTFQKELKNNNKIDNIITGEGEKAFLYLIQDIQKYGKDIVKIYHGTDYIKNLDDLPSPDRQYDPTIYAKYGRQLTQRIWKDECRTATIQISRGCPQKCSYCSGHVVTNRDYRIRNIQSIIDEIKMLKEKYDIECWILNEENPNINIKHTKKLYKALIPLNIKWYSNAGFYCSNIDKEFVDLAMKSGLIYWNLAIESGSKRIQRLTGKNEKIVDNAIKVVKWVREKNKYVSITGFFMINFPFENKEDINDTLNLIDKLDLNCIQWNSLQCFKGSELYDYCIGKDLLDNKDNTENFYMNSRIKNENGLTKEYIDNIINETNLKYNFINNYDFRHGYYERAKRFAEHVLSICPAHKKAKILLGKINEKMFIL